MDRRSTASGWSVCVAPARRLASWVALAALAAITPAPGAAQTDEEVAAARARFEVDPPVGETVQAALRHFRVSPDAIDALRRASRARALMPLVAGGYRFDDDAETSFEQQRLFQPREVDGRGAVRRHSVTAGAIWDLREAVFNPAQIQAYGLVGVQRDVMLEVTRTYYMRRLLQLRLALRPPEDELARMTLELRVEEFTAILDALTGGWFARELVARARARRAD